MDNSDVRSSAGPPISSGGKLVKQWRKQRREKFLAGIRGKLESVSHQLAFSPAEAGIVCSKSPTWAYRKIYDGTFKVINAEDGRLLIPRSEIERFLGGAAEMRSPAESATREASIRSESCEFGTRLRPGSAPA
jgi:hypothetical protein